MTFELAGIDDTDGNENNIAKVVGKKPLDVEQCMDSDTVEVAHDEDRSRRIRVFHWSFRVERGLKRNAQERIVEAFECYLDPIVMPTHRLTDQHESQRNHNRHPATFGKFGRDRHEKNRAGSNQSQSIDPEFAFPRS